MVKKINVVYCRVSTDKKDKENTFEQDPSLQLLPIYESFPESRDAQVILERGSAWKKNGNSKRPEFERMCKMIEAGEVDTVYIYHLNRLARNAMKALDFLRLCIDKEVKMCFVQQKFLSELSGIPGALGQFMKRMIFDLYATFAELESTEKSDKIKTTVVRNPGDRTRSYKGRAWGREITTPPSTIQHMKSLHGENLSLREIGKQAAIYEGRIKAYGPSSVKRLIAI